MHQPLAYIHSDADIERNVVIEPFVTIEKNVVIGRKSTQHVYLNMKIQKMKLIHIS